MERKTTEESIEGLNKRFSTKTHRGEHHFIPLLFGKPLPLQMLISVFTSHIPFQKLFLTAAAPFQTTLFFSTFLEAEKALSDLIQYLPFLILMRKAALL
jgi:hypothetical protein